MIMFGHIARLFHKKHYQWRKDLRSSLGDPTSWPEAWKHVEYKTYPRARQVLLPDPEEVNISLEKVLRNRHSSRTFSQHSISLRELSALLQLSAGRNKSRTSDLAHALRHYPSAGALYPLELYLYATDQSDLPAGLYHYNVSDHRLEQLGVVDHANTLRTALPTWACTAPMTFFITSVWDRNLQKYQNFGYHLVLMEAGHLTQNIQLVAEALGLAYCSYVGFDNEILERMLDLDKRESENLLYITSLGKPEGQP